MIYVVCLILGVILTIGVFLVYGVYLNTKDYLKHLKGITKKELREYLKHKRKEGEV